jgi:hypothetical protein
MFGRILNRLQQPFRISESPEAERDHCRRPVCVRKSELKIKSPNVSKEKLYEYLRLVVVGSQREGV